MLEQIELENYEQATERSEQVKGRTGQLYTRQIIISVIIGICGWAVAEGAELDYAPAYGAAAGGGLFLYYFLFDQEEFKIRDRA